jgi:hypothetical protein
VAPETTRATSETAGQTPELLTRFPKELITLL